MNQPYTVNRLEIKDMEPFDFEIQDVPRLVEMYEKCKPEYDELYQYAIRG